MGLGVCRNAPNDCWSPALLTHFLAIKKKLQKEKNTKKTNACSTQIPFYAHKGSMYIQTDGISVYSSLRSSFSNYVILTTFLFQFAIKDEIGDFKTIFEKCRSNIYLPT